MMKLVQGTLLFRRSITFSSTLFAKTMTVKEAVYSAIDEEIERDDKVMMFGEDIGRFGGGYGVTEGLWTKYGDSRIIDTPISEMGFTGISIGAGMAGLRPICEFMTFNFSMQAIDQIINSAAKIFYMSAGQIHVPIVFRGPNGPSSTASCAQHNQCLASWYAHCPGLKVLSPWSSEDHRGLLKAAIRDPDPVVFLENAYLYDKSYPVSDEVLSKNFLLPIGKAKIERHGHHITLIAHSRSVTVCVEAAKELAEQGIEAEIINLRSLRPIDNETIFNSVEKTKCAITVEHGWHQHGIGSEICARIMESEVFFRLKAPVIRLTGVDIPMPYPKNHEDAASPRPLDVVAAARKLLKKQ